MKLLTGNLDSSEFATTRGITEILTELLSPVLRHLFSRQVFANLTDQTVCFTAPSGEKQH